ncbi:hypothetical protein [Tabrizicola oligotrophica]|uniref:DUF3551 domain-containing protein n=1 Tax=Tabrizicola oligotrophica TaxID=2710650 RepID=A0A6M0QS82_9RHOB|nr:hypothetical protein [Tabrizicola oligotrophica]NEY90379.1 hypothetical protein [Tabrizicola oligotrophica]
MHRKQASVFAVAAVLTVFSAAQAGASCTDWMDQGDGTSWATCVDDAGVQHCYRISNTPGSTAYEVSCSA